MWYIVALDLYAGMMIAVLLIRKRVEITLSREHFFPIWLIAIGVYFEAVSYIVSVYHGDTFLSYFWICKDVGIGLILFTIQFGIVKRKIKKYLISIKKKKWGKSNGKNN